jgi:predicted dehydrogenase
MSQIKIGIVGTSWWTDSMYMPALTRHPNADAQPYERADDSAMMMLEFENGARGVIHVTALAYKETSFGQIHQMEFHGSRGTLHSFTDWDQTQNVSGARAGEGAVHDLPIPDHVWGSARRDNVPETYKDVFRDHDFMARGFVSAIANNIPMEPTFRDGARIQRYLEAALLSAQEGRRVEVKEIQAKE